MTSENLLNLIDGVVKSRSEYQNVELKAAKHGCPERFYDTLSSFSNRDDGGVIIFGNQRIPRYGSIGNTEQKLTNQYASDHTQNNPDAVECF